MLSSGVTMSGSGFCDVSAWSGMKFPPFGIYHFPSDSIQRVPHFSTSVSVRLFLSVNSVSSSRMYPRPISMTPVYESHASVMRLPVFGHHMCHSFMMILALHSRMNHRLPFQDFFCQIHFSYRARLVPERKYHSQTCCPHVPMRVDPENV